MTDSQPAQPSRAFWRISPRRLSKLSARSFSMICSAVRSPTRGGAHPHDHQPGPQFPLARLVWQSRQRSLPRGTASGPVGHWSLSHRAPGSTSTRAAPARWSIWHGGRSLRSRWLRFRDPRQRLHRPGSSARAGAAGTCLPISPNSARKARSCAASTTVQKCRLAPRACRVAWW